MTSVEEVTGSVFTKGGNRVAQLVLLLSESENGGKHTLVPSKRLPRQLGTSNTAVAQLNLS